MAQLSEAQRQWVNNFLSKTRASNAGLAAVRGVVPASDQSLQDGGEVLDGSPLAGSFDEGYLAGVEVSADSGAPDSGRFNVRVKRIPPVAPGGGTESEREDIWVELVTGNISEEVSIYEMVNSRDYVNNEISDVKGILDPNVPFTERPKIKEMKVIYNGGNYVVVPMNLVRHSPRPQAKRYLRKAEGKLIFPVDKRGNALFDTINTSNIILCADYLEHLLAERLAQNLKVIELGAKFASIVAMNSAAAGGGSPKSGGGSYRPVSKGPQSGGSTGGRSGGSGKPTTGSGNSRTSGTGSGGAGGNRAGGTAGRGTSREPANVGSDGLSPTSMRLDEPKGPAKPVGGGVGSPKTVGGGSSGKPAGSARKTDKNKDGSPKTDKKIVKATAPSDGTSGKSTGSGGTTPRPTATRTRGEARREIGETRTVVRDLKKEGQEILDAEGINVPVRREKGTGGAVRESVRARDVIKGLERVANDPGSPRQAEAKRLLDKLKPLAKELDDLNIEIDVGRRDRI